MDNKDPKRDGNEKEKEGGDRVGMGVFTLHLIVKAHKI